MVQDGAKKKNKNKKKSGKKNQSQQPDSPNSEHQSQTVQPAVVAEAVQPTPPTNNANPKKLVNGVKNPQQQQPNSEAVLKNLASEADRLLTYNWAAIHDAESKYQAYLATQKKTSSGKVALTFPINSALLFFAALHSHILMNTLFYRKRLLKHLRMTISTSLLPMRKSQPQNQLLRLRKRSLSSKTNLR